MSITPFPDAGGSYPAATLTTTGTIASAGTVRLPNLATVKARNPGNTADVQALSINASGVTLGTTANPAYVAGSTLNIEAAGNLIVTAAGGAVCLTAISDDSTIRSPTSSGGVAQMVTSSYRLTYASIGANGFSFGVCAGSTEERAGVYINTSDGSTTSNEVIVGGTFKPGTGRATHVVASVTCRDASKNQKVWHVPISCKDIAGTASFSQATAPDATLFVVGTPDATVAGALLTFLPSGNGIQAKPQGVSGVPLDWSVVWHKMNGGNP